MSINFEEGKEVKGPRELPHMEVVLSFEQHQPLHELRTFDPADFKSW